MKLIYIIIAHGDPSLLVRLIDKLDSPESRFLIHVDKKTSKDVFIQYKHAFTTKANVIFLPRIRVYWGDFSIVQVEFNAMEFVRKNDFDYDYAILLSGSHYPIKRKETIDQFFQNNKGSIFLEHRSLPTDFSHPWALEEGGMGRVLYWHFTRYFWLEKMIFWHFRLFLEKNGLGMLLKRKYEFDLKLYGHSQWWCLDKAAIEYVSDFVNKNPKFINFFKFTHIPDEMLIQTILMNSGHKDRIINDNLTFVRWPTQVGIKSPCVLSRDDLKNLMQSHKLFARKFDYHGGQALLDGIDRVCQ